MGGGSEPQNNEAVESGNKTKQFRAADNRSVTGNVRTIGMTGGENAQQDTVGLVRELIVRLGGEHAVLEQVSACLTVEDSVGKKEISDSTNGYCYLRFFDRVEWRDAVKLGFRPTVAELRRFSNGRADPFGSRMLVVTVCRDEIGRVAHVEYNAGGAGLRPVEALAALAKDCQVGGIPDGPTTDFPPAWIPAKLHAYQCWEYIEGSGKRNLDFLSWVGEIRDDYELVSADSSRLRWIVSTSPVGPDTANIDIIPPNGKTLTLKRWESSVAHTRYHQDWIVRGERVFVEVYVWRAAKFTTTPGAPLPAPGPGQGGHDELFMSDERTVDTLVSSSGQQYRNGYCYLDAVDPHLPDVDVLLGPCPKMEDILQCLAEAKLQAKFPGCVFQSGHDLALVSPGLYHVVSGNLTGQQFLTKLSGLPRGSRVGATQTSAVVPSGQENISEAAQLSIRPKRPGTLINVAFASKLTPESPILYWDLTAGKKLNGLLTYFESAELESLSIRATVHKGDGDTIFHLAADTVAEMFKTDMDWVGAPHTLHVSGNVQGATNGDMVLKGNHGFGTQLKGVAVGNPTPIIQGWLETTVAANVLLKAVVSVRVTGTGNPRSIVLPAKRASGNMVNVMDDDDSDDDEPMTSGPSGKCAGK